MNKRIKMVPVFFMYFNSFDLVDTFFMLPVFCMDVWFPYPVIVLSCFLFRFTKTPKSLNHSVFLLKKI